jgi:hypothetical protein
MQMHTTIFFNGYFLVHCDPLMVLKRVHSQALKPDSLQTLMHHLISFTIQLENVLLLRITGLQPICERKLNIHFEVLINENQTLILQMSYVVQFFKKELKT